MQQVRYEKQEAKHAAQEDRKDYVGEVDLLRYESREDVAPGADFFLDLGGSSLDYLALIAALRERYRIDFPVENGSSVSTVATLAAFIRSAGTHVD